MSRPRAITAADRLCLIAMLIGASVALWACTTPNSDPFDAPIAWGRP